MYNVTWVATQFTFTTFVPLLVGYLYLLDSYKCSLAHELGKSPISEQHCCFPRWTLILGSTPSFTYPLLIYPVVNYAEDPQPTNSICESISKRAISSVLRFNRWACLIGDLRVAGRPKYLKCMLYGFRRSVRKYFYFLSRFCRLALYLNSYDFKRLLLLRNSSVFSQIQAQNTSFYILGNRYYYLYFSRNLRCYFHVYFSINDDHFGHFCW